MRKLILPILIIAISLFPSISYETEAVSELDDICKNIDNSYKCAQAIENYQQKHWGQYFTRKNGQMELALMNGGNIFLKDTDDTPTTAPEKVLLYSFRDYIQSIGYFLIHVQTYEDFSYLMISAKSGKRFDIPAPPHLSPSNARFVAVSAKDYGFNGIEIWKITLDTLQLEWRYEPKEYALYNFIGWINEGSIKLNKCTIKEKKVENIFQLLVRDNSGTWKLMDEAK